MNHVLIDHVMMIHMITVNHEKHVKYKNENLAINVHENNGFDVERADT